MTGAMYAAIAGLRTHMQNLNVIGNNIANINTNSYKPSRSVFRSALYTQISGGSSGSTTVGGTNPSQIGYGANMANVDKDMSTGTYAPGKNTDVMIDGEGFFLVGDKNAANLIDPNDPSTLTTLTLTRVGDFSFKADGYLTDGPGNVVYGFLCTGIDPDTGIATYSDQLVPLRYPRQDAQGNVLYPYQATEDDEAAYGVEVNRLIDNLYGFDGEGDGTTIRRPDLTTEEGQVEAANMLCGFASLDNISIDEKTGVISGMSRTTGQNVIVGCIAIGMVTNPDGVTAMSDSYYKAGQGSGDLSINLLGGARETLGIDYINKSMLGEDADADDENAQPQGMLIGDGGTTGLIPGGLEQSKTDLATEISNMITTQRGYQANTRIITVTDSMLEELVNMKR